MKIQPLTPLVYYALHQREGKEYVGLGFTHTEALINCLRAVKEV